MILDWSRLQEPINASHRFFPDRCLHQNEVLLHGSHEARLSPSRGNLVEKSAGASLECVRCQERKHVTFGDLETGLVWKSLEVSGAKYKRLVATLHEETEDNGNYCFKFQRESFFIITVQKYVLSAYESKERKEAVFIHLEFFNAKTEHQLP